MGVKNIMITPEQLYEVGCGSYRNVKVLEAGPYKGHYAHTAAMLFTVGIMVSYNDTWGWACRWCYPNYRAAKHALAQWDGQGDPPGPWIKYKGSDGERTRPV